ncbi:MAG: polymorphic toxin-type HINT domain-containing protein [Phycisphaerales bacterium]
MLFAALVFLIPGTATGAMAVPVARHGVANPADLICPCPPIKPESTAKDRKSDVVIGTFRTTHAVAMDLYVEGLDKPIGTTASHPFYSVDRGGWTAAGELKPGETLRTQSGTTKVVRSMTKPGTQAVYNLEVHRSHTYFVPDAKRLVHNSCPAISPKIRN